MGTGMGCTAFSGARSAEIHCKKIASSEPFWRVFAENAGKSPFHAEPSGMGLLSTCGHFR